jgi:hypothetical protein
MASWTELVTVNNIGEYIDQDTFVDVRRWNNLTMKGIWFRNMTTCPYLRDSVAFGNNNAQNTNTWDRQLGFGRSHCYMIPAGSTANDKNYNIGLSLTTGKSQIFNASDPNGDGTEWGPAITKDMMQEAIYNPWASSGDGMKIVSSKIEVIYGNNPIGNNSYNVDLGFTWGVMDHPVIDLTHQEKSAFALPRSATTVNSYTGSTFTATTYTDNGDLERINLIGPTQTTNTHIVAVNGSANEGIGISEWGYQTTDVIPSSIYSPASGDPNYIAPDRALIPILGSTCTPETPPETTGWLSDTVTFGTTNQSIALGNIVYWPNVAGTLVTILKREA